MVGINVPIPVPVGYHSFGGWKDSALRRHDHVRPRGRPLLHPAKVVTSRWPDPATSSVDLGFPTNE